MQWRHVGAVWIGGVALLACASPPAHVWVNAVSPQRVYAGDSQECQVIAQSLAANATGYLQVVTQLAQWKTCMEARGWKQVTPQVESGPRTSGGNIGSLPTPDTASIASGNRWHQIYTSSTTTMYLDAQSIDRAAASAGYYDVWLKIYRTAPDTNATIAREFLVARTRMDCGKIQYRMQNVYLYGVTGDVVAQRDLTLQGWVSPPPESEMESALRAGCAFVHTPSTAPTPNGSPSDDGESERQITARPLVTMFHMRVNRATLPHNGRSPTVQGGMMRCQCDKYFDHCTGRGNTPGIFRFRRFIRPTPAHMRGYV